MTWYKVDDKLHSHKKAIKAGDAMALWVMAGSWAADQLSDGFVPDYVVTRMFPAEGEAWADKLVSVGLWEPAHHDGDDGWAFHQWDDHQPTRADVEAKRETERDRKRRQRRNPGGQFEESKRSPHGVPVGQVTDSHQDSLLDSAPSHTVPSRPDPSHKKDDGYTAEFESFWKMYPSTANKAGAFKAYKVAAKKHDNLEGKLRAYLGARTRIERSGKFLPAIPNASTWLNQERWNDYGELTTITRADGATIPQLSKDECDEILGGKDYWSCPRPPEGLDLMAEREWKQARTAEHLNERRQKAWEVMNSDAA